MNAVSILKLVTLHHIQVSMALNHLADILGYEFLYDFDYDSVRTFGVKEMLDTINDNIGDNEFASQSDIVFVETIKSLLESLPEKDLVCFVQA